MLNNLLLNFGEGPGKPPLSIRPGAMTVLVGPNNSGKSLTLREIQKYISHRASYADSADQEPLRIVSSLCPETPTPGELLGSILAEVEQDIAPFRNSLMVVPGLTPEKLLERFDPSHIMGVINELNKLGHLRKLAEHRKIDPSLLSLIDKTDLARQPTLVALALEFLRQLTRYLERHQETLENITQRHADSPALSLVENRVVQMDGYVGHFAPFTVLLDGKGRLKLTDPQRISSLRDSPDGMMMRLFKNKEEMAALRDHVLDAFGCYLVLDFTRMSEGHFVISDNPPGAFEGSFASDEALTYFQQATSVSELSDGVKSYIGLHATLLSHDYRVILVDEPEAFLHPPLARSLGYNLTRLAALRGASVVAATHSPYFLMGCVEAQRGVNIIRLGYRAGVPTARALAAADLQRMMHDPLLRSTGVLSALFHECAIVCEGDSDQAFYDEINERLRRSANNDGEAEQDVSYAKHCLFINAHGKGSVSTLLGALRQMGVPSVGVVDLDVLKDPGIAVNLVREGGAGEGGCVSVGQLRGKVHEAFEAEARRRLISETGAEPKEDQVRARRSELIKRGGLSNLTKDGEKRDLQQFLDTLAMHGIFVPECGELERWLPRLSSDIGKDGWLEAMFGKMGSPDEPATYLEPGDDDVWEFMRKIASWLDEHAVDPPKRSREE